ncbi:hypothetical protein ACHAP5_008543 [Fusarium lateritium]
MKTNWLSAALILGAAGSDGAGALASEVPGALAGVKFISDVEDIFILIAFVTFCYTVGWPWAPFLCLFDYVFELEIIF